MCVVYTAASEELNMESMLCVSRICEGQVLYAGSVQHVQHLNIRATGQMASLQSTKLAHCNSIRTASSIEFDN